jgi:hypothetical protein
MPLGRTVSHSDPHSGQDDSTRLLCIPVRAELGSLEHQATPACTGCLRTRGHRRHFPSTHLSSARQCLRRRCSAQSLLAMSDGIPPCTLRYSHRHQNDTHHSSPHSGLSGERNSSVQPHAVPMTDDATRTFVRAVSALCRVAFARLGRALKVATDPTTIRLTFVCVVASIGVVTNHAFSLAHRRPVTVALPVVRPPCWALLRMRDSRAVVQRVGCRARNTCAREAAPRPSSSRPARVPIAGVVLSARCRCLIVSHLTLCGTPRVSIVSITVLHTPVYHTNKRLQFSRTLWQRLVMQRAPCVLPVPFVGLPLHFFTVH